MFIVFVRTTWKVKPSGHNFLYYLHQLFGRCIEQSQANMKAPLASEAHFKGWYSSTSISHSERWRLISEGTPLTPYCLSAPLLSLPSFPFWRPALNIKTLHGWVSQQITTANKWEKKKKKEKICPAICHQPLMFSLFPPLSSPLFTVFLPLSSPLPYRLPLGYCPGLLNKHDLSPSFSLLHLVRASLLMLDWLCPSTQGSLTRCKIPANTHETDTAVGLTFECLLRSTVIFALNKIMPTRRICRWHLPFVKLRWQWSFTSH